MSADQIAKLRDGLTLAFSEKRRRSTAASVASRRSGLVTESTSDTTFSQGLKRTVVDTRSSRMRRMRYNVIASANFINAAYSRPGFRPNVVFITLTYRTIEQPEPKHITGFVKTVREHLRRRGESFQYVWVAELQQRGVLHYHLIAWLPPGYRLPKPDKSGWWPHGWSNIKRATSPVGYLANYAGKLKTKAIAGGFAIPKGFRLYAPGGLDAEDRQKRAWANLPGWLRDRTTPADRCKRIKGGGFVARETWDYWPSPFRIVSVQRAGSGAFVTIAPALPEGTELCSPF